MEAGLYGPLTDLLASHLLIGTLILYAVLVWIRWTGPALDAQPIDWRSLVPITRVKLSDAPAQKNAAREGGA